MAKLITERQRIEAFAYYTMAVTRYVEAREFERSASAILGVNGSSDPYNDFISDGIYGYERPLSFDQVLKNAQITVRPKEKAKRT